MLVEKKKNAKSIWLQLETDLHNKKNKAGLNIWKITDEHHSLAKYRPWKADHIECAEIEEKEGVKSYMLHNPANDKYLILGEKDLFLWDRMDGRKTVKDLYIELTMEYGLVSQKAVFSLMKILKNNGFFHNKPISVFQDINDRVRQHRFIYHIKEILDYLFHARLTSKKADIFFSWLYTKLTVIFRKPLVFLMVGMLVIDLGLSSYFVFVQHESMLLTPESGAGSHDIIAMMVITYLSIFVHELAHGLAVKHYGRKVLRAGMKLLFGSPIAYVDTTDILMKGRVPRMGVSFAGPCINGVIGCILLVLSLVIPESIYENLLIHGGLINSLLFIVNLIPFSETDGHYIIQDWFGQPHLRQESLNFLRRGMWRKFGKKENWQKEDFGHLIYGSISVVGLCYLIAKGVHLWFFTGRHLLNKALQEPQMVIEILAFSITLVLVIALLRTLASWKGKRINITYLLEGHFND